MHCWPASSHAPEDSSPPQPGPLGSEDGWALLGFEAPEIIIFFFLKEKMYPQGYVNIVVYLDVHIKQINKNAA